MNEASNCLARTSPDARRNLVVFCDGTWNSPEEEEFGQSTATNVHKLFVACEDEAESHGEQITWYQPGVGSDGGRYRRAFEGATGTGMGLNIRRGYAALAAHYKAGDRIYLIGFSRGAFAARSIAGMIEKVGLLKDPSRSAVKRAYDLYRRVRIHSDPRLVVHRASPAVHFDVRVHALGVWETVGALGLSLWGWSFNFRLLWRNSFHRLSPNRITDHVYHALALDETRTSFVPVAWNDGTRDSTVNGDSSEEKFEIRSPIVEELWFRGVHSDVGGGYGDARLSDVTLDWMTRKLAHKGLRLRPNMPAVVPEPTGRIHNSARGPLWTKVATWPRWAPLKTIAEEATLGTRHCLHESVAARERNASAAGIFEQKRRWLRIGETARIAIRARYLWEYTGIVLEPGARYELRASGYWQDWKDSPVGPEGQAVQSESILKRFSRKLKRVPEARWFELIALPCHDFGWHWKELGIGAALRYFLIDDPVEFTSQFVRVGRGCDLAISAKSKEAMLWCFANDARKFYGNNTGSVVLEVSRVE